MNIKRKMKNEVNDYFYTKYGKIEKFRLLLKKYNILDISSEEFTERIIQNMLDSLGDKYAEYYNPNEMELLYADYVIERARQEGFIINARQEVVKCLPEGEAHIVGLREGDIVISINNILIQNENLIRIYSMLHERPVSIEVERNNKRFVYELTENPKVYNKEVINEEKCVKGQHCGEWLYLKLNTFGNTCLTEFKKFLNDTAEENLILDLRDNQGGNISQCIEIAELLLSRNSKICNIVYGTYKEQQYVRVGARQKYNIHVIVNETTGSAAELLTSAIKDNGGKIYGKRTLGKGKIQLIYPFDKFDGSGVKISIAEVFTIREEQIEGVGIEPTNYIENIDEYVEVEDIISMIKECV